MKLVLVESPSKCASISKYLGSAYKVMATYGHFRELKSLKNIIFGKPSKKGEMETERVKILFTVDTSPRKQRLVRDLAVEIQMASEVILATDDDREGEAIAWHVCDHFSLPIETTKRIVFHEITRESILRAIDTPRQIHMNMVYSQFARQILDLLIGFKISPLLWRYISKNEENSLSAGRCQTPALQMIYNKYETATMVDKCTSGDTCPQSITGYFTEHHIPFELSENTLTSNPKDILDFLESSKTHTYNISIGTPIRKEHAPPMPLNTSKLLQASYNVLGLSPKDTMRVCQELYEKGLITYMRTDNTKYSNQFVKSVGKFIVSQTLHHPQLTHNSHRLVEHSDKAHEAIRPTNIGLTELTRTTDKRVCRMYKLIWNHTMASCLEPSVTMVLPCVINAPRDLVYTYEAIKIITTGWTKYDTSHPKLVGINPYDYLISMRTPSVVTCHKIKTKARSDFIPGQYTEASMVRALEEEGIGRPSTYASILDKLQTKAYAIVDDIPGKDLSVTEYEMNGSSSLSSVTKTPDVVVKVGNARNRLIIQNTGIVVVQFLYAHFEPIFNLGYTKQTELELDSIVTGELDWMDVCVRNKVHISGLIKAMTAKKVEKFGVVLDESNTYMFAKYGPVIKHTNVDGDVSFIAVRKDVDVSSIQKREIELKDIVKPLDETMASKRSGEIFGTYQGNDILVKTGRYGRFIVWGDVTKSIKCFGTRDMCNITMSEMCDLLNKPVRGRASKGKPAREKTTDCK